MSAADGVDGSALSGVPETLLWTLRNRAEESARADSEYHDPIAEHAYGRIRHLYDFGAPSESHALRARAFDGVTRRFLAEHPGGTVVALGEGLQTSYWRLGRPNVRWVSVDVPEAIALRERVLPAEPAVEHVAGSALDRAWMDRVDPAGGVLVTAEGLLMYFEPDDAVALIADCAARFPGGWMLFDSIPSWFSRVTLEGYQLSDTYTAPPMPFGLDADQALALGRSTAGVRHATEVPFPAGRELWVDSPADSLGAQRPSITLLEFGPAPPAPFALSSNYVLVRRGGTMQPVAKAGAPPRIDGVTLGLHHLEHDSPHAGELHPDGDELLVVLAGAITVELAVDTGVDGHVAVAAGQGCIVPRGVWHRILVSEPATLLHLTPGPGFEIRWP